MTLGDKFKEVRKLLNLTQSEMGDGIGVPQKVVSYVENNKRDFIPTEYFYFLQKNNIDLNTIFNFDVNVGFLTTGSSDYVDNLPQEELIEEELSIENINQRLKDLECVMDAIKLKFKIDEELEQTINSASRKTFSKEN